MGSMPQDDGILGVAGGSNEPMVSSLSLNAFNSGLGYFSHERTLYVGSVLMVVVLLQQILWGQKNAY